MEGEIRERAVNGRCHRIICNCNERKKCVHEVNGDLRNSILLPTLAYGSDLNKE